MKNLFILLFHDFAFATRSRSFFLVLFIPLFVFVSEKLLDRSKEAPEKFKVAFVQSVKYPEVLLKAVSSAEKNLDVRWAKDEEEARRFLKDREVQGALISEASSSGALTLVVLRQDSPHSLALLQFFSALQRSTEKKNPSWISGVNALQEGGLQKQAFPTWILMLVLLVGFIVLPSQVAEEKEKNLILAFLQTPITEAQWLLGKTLFGILLTLLSVGFLSVLSRFFPEQWGPTLGLLILGGFCFSAFGIFLGLLCRHQAGARTLGFIFYLPLLLPSALADFSQKLTVIAPFIPSYQFYHPLRTLLLGEGEPVHLLSSMISLFVLGLILSGFSYLLVLRRWLM